VSGFYDKDLPPRGPVPISSGSTYPIWLSFGLKESSETRVTTRHVKYQGKTDCVLTFDTDQLKKDIASVTGHSCGPKSLAQRNHHDSSYREHRSDDLTHGEGLLEENRGKNQDVDGARLIEDCRCAG